MAYVASLSALFSSPESCTGKVSCSVCGDRPNHYLRGDIASIREGIADTLGLALDEGRDVSALVGSVYSKQRSAYVHDAVLRRSELKDFPVNIHRPTENSPVSDELQFAEDLHDIQRLETGPLPVFEALSWFKGSLGSYCQILASQLEERLQRRSI